jgi:hypothetical protein
MTLFIPLTKLRVKSFALTTMFVIPLIELQITILKVAVLMPVNALNLAIIFHSLIVIRVLSLAITFRMIAPYLTVLAESNELSPFPYKKHYYYYSLPLRNCHQSWHSLHR